MLTADNKTIRLTLASWRKARGLTQEEMAKRLDIPTVTYTRWEKRPQRIPVDKALEAAAVLDVDFGSIIFLPSNDTKCVTAEEV